MSRHDLSASAPGPGHLGCPGCGQAIGLRLVLESIGSNAIMVVPACCASYVDGIWPHSAARIPLLHVAIGATAAAAAGVRAALEVKGHTETKVLAWNGGSGVFDSDMPSISSAAERNDDIFYVCHNSEWYVDSFPHSQATAAAHSGGRRRSIQSKNVMEIMAAHHVPYCATACVAFPDDLCAKVKKALAIKGFKFILLLSPCPTGWQIPSELSIELARDAVLSRLFPLYEIHDGTDYTISVKPDVFVPVSHCLSRQGRFAGMKLETMKQIQSRVETLWKQLLRKTEL